MLNFDTPLSWADDESDARSDHQPGHSRRAEVRRDSDLLDADSQAVIGVVARVGPAVVSITGFPSDRERYALVGRLSQTRGW